MSCTKSRPSLGHRSDQDLVIDLATEQAIPLLNHSDAAFRMTGLEHPKRTEPDTRFHSPGDV